MSKETLLNLDELQQATQPKPKVRPRKAIGSAFSDEPSTAPLPKPRKKYVEKDVDEEISMSSRASSSGDHITKASFANPVFENDSDESQRSIQMLQHSPPTKDDNHQQRPSKRTSVKSPSFSPNAKHNYFEDESSSMEDESYLYVEKEHSLSQRYKSRTKQHLENAKDQVEMKSLDREKPDHVSIPIEQSTEIDQSKKGDENTEDSNKSSIWKKIALNKLKFSAKKFSLSEKITTSKRSSNNASSITTPDNSTNKSPASAFSDASAKRKPTTLKPHTEIETAMPKRKTTELSETSSDTQSEDKENDMESPTVSKPLHPLRSRRKAVIKNPLPSMEELEAGDNRDLLFAVTIHMSDQLPWDPNIRHPLVKLHVMSQSGDYIRSSVKSPKSRKHQKKSHRQKSHMKTMQPMLTQPFSLNASDLSPVLSPSWNELLLFEENYLHTLKRNPNLILLFEVLDFLPADKLALIDNGFHGSEPGWYKVAWAFLKPCSAEGLYVQQKLRLQLYKPVKLKPKPMDGPEVFSWWKSGQRDKVINTTLYVTVKGVTPPAPTTASIRQLLTMKKKDLTNSMINDEFKAKSDKKNKKKHSKEDIQIDLRKVVQWTKLAGQTCKVPNKFLASLPSAKLKGTHVTVSGNVHAVKFSPCGLKLAAGFDTDEIHAVLMFEIPSGNLVRSMKHHNGLIYDIQWKEVNLDEINYIQYLGSASADGTSCIWKMKNNIDQELHLMKVLHHPTFVYTIAFHPSHPSLCATGCYDNIIRIWDILSEEDVDVTSSLFMLQHHSSYVNCFVFGDLGSYAFSGDGQGSVIKWSIGTPHKQRAWKPINEAKLDDWNAPINALSVHPTGLRLLVHLRSSVLKILDTDTFMVLQDIRGISNDRLQIKSCFTPCGDFIISGSEDSRLCIWDSSSYSLVKGIEIENHVSCFVTSLDYHPKDFYLCIGIASQITESNPILLYTYNIPKLSEIALVQAGVAKFKSQLYNARAQGTKRVTFAELNDNSAKFMNIIEKLDKALKEVQLPREEAKPPKRKSSVGHLNALLETTPNSRLSTSAKEEIRSKQKKSSKSPRSYIEDRLEELLISKPEDIADNSKKIEITTEKSGEESCTVTSNEQIAAFHRSSHTNIASLLSPKYLKREKQDALPANTTNSVPCSPEKRQKMVSLKYKRTRTEMLEVNCLDDDNESWD